MYLKADFDRMAKGLQPVYSVARYGAVHHTKDVCTLLFWKHFITKSLSTLVNVLWKKEVMM
jgi:hypothetical protein